MEEKQEEAEVQTGRESMRVCVYIYTKRRGARQLAHPCRI